MDDIRRLLERLETLVEEVRQLDEPARGRVFELLDGVDVLHRTALANLGAALERRGVDPADLRDVHPSIRWLFDAYAVDVDEAAAADAALDDIRPYIHSHGGEVEVLDVTDGIVHLRMSGACSGCTASAVTLREGVEEALRDGLPGFVSLVVEEDEDAEEHPPPGATLLEIQSGPPDGFR